VWVCRHDEEKEGGGRKRPIDKSEKQERSYKPIPTGIFFLFMILCLTLLLAGNRIAGQYLRKGIICSHSGLWNIAFPFRTDKHSYRQSMPSIAL
jgi:hypothetical protein